MKKQTKDRFSEPPKITFWVLNILLLIVLASCKKGISTENDAAPPTTEIMFQKTYGGSSNEIEGSVLQTSDDGYAISGSSNGDFYLVKTDKNGEMLWNKTYDGGQFEVPYFVRQTSDHGYILTGDDEPNTNIIIVRADSSGNLSWSKQFSTNFDAWGFACLQATDGGFVFAGQANYDVVLFKLDLNGNLLWSYSFDAGDFEEGLSLQKTSDGGYCIAGYTGSCDTYLIKTDGNGNLLWSKRYDMGLSDAAFSVQQCSDGGFILSGRTGESSNHDIYLLKTDPDGNVLWSKLYDNYGEWNFSQKVLQTNDQGYLVIGTENYSNIWVIKTDINGNIIWSKTYGGTGWDIALRTSAGEQTSDGGYIISGYSTSFGGSSDLYVIKTNAAGESGCNEKDDLMPVVTTLPVHATDPNTIVTVTPGTWTNYSMKTGSGGVETTLCYTHR